MTLRSASFALITALAVPSIAAADTKPVAAQVEKTVAPTQASTEANNYEQRDAKDKKDVQDYRGGNTVVIAMSGGAFILLLFLLLLV
jgi:hypothetical protein